MVVLAWALRDTPGDDEIPSAARVPILFGSMEANLAVVTCQ